MGRLDNIDSLERYYRKKIKYIKDYEKARNAATGSKFDSNANVESKNITTLAGELPKEDYIGTNRLLMCDKLTEMYGKDFAEEYLRQLNAHEIYKHDETSIYPYTYSSKEVVNVVYKGKKYLISLEQLYILCEEDEELVDNEKIVYIKYPKDMSIYDRNGYTKVQRLIRKKRHRDLVRIKTAFGEDLIVTDNHPLIVNDDIDNTVDAINSLGLKQYRYHTQIDYDNIFDIDVRDIDPSLIIEEYNDFYGIQEKQRCKTLTAPKKIVLDEKFGYLIGFILGDGNYNFTDSKICSSISITQKDKEILQKLGSIAFEKTGAIPTISHKNDKVNCYVLRLESPVLVTLMWDIFRIGHMAHNKCLPWNIYQTNRDFAFGIIEGLIDSDGTITSNQSIQIRVASRTMILQLSDLLRNFGFRVANTIQDTQFSNNSIVQQKYQIYGVTFSENENTPPFNISYKIKQSKKHDKGVKYKFDTWATITDVDKITNEKFLETNNYIYDITTESHSFICNNIWVHNCVSITMYPFLFDGMRKLGGKSIAPKHLQSFCGSFTNLVFAVASQFAGAVATPEFLTYMDYFIRREYGDDYYLHADDVAEISLHPRTIKQIIEKYFSQVTYSLNEPAGARNSQSVFWNIAYFDEPYFNGIFHDFVFPDGTSPTWESVKWLQELYMRWFNKERLRAELTFPVESMSLLNDGNDFIDQDTFDLVAQMYSEGHSFFTYTSDSVDSLSSCCFDGSQVVKCRDKNGEYVGTFKDIYKKHLDINTLEVSHYGEWKKCGIICMPMRPMYEITIGEKVVRCTDNHIFPINNKSDMLCHDEVASKIKVGDYIPVYHEDTKCSVGEQVTSIEKYTSIYDEVYCFVMEDQTNPYFTLGNGVITHNCRLRNEITDNTFSYTLGAGGVSTGSKGVMTININRLVQNAVRDGVDISDAIKEQVEKVHKYLLAFNEIIKDDYKANLLGVYNAGFISLDRQYLTVGINGFIEGAEFLGIDISPNEKYFEYGEKILKPIYELNKRDKTKDVMFNTEFVPAENLGVKNAKWDKEDGYVVPRDCYNSYFYIVEDETCDPITKLILHGGKLTRYLDGGSALHCNLSEHLTKDQYKHLLRVAVKEKVPYLTFNIPNTVCNSCGHISKHMLEKCPVCGSEDVDYLTRVIGYLKRVSKFSHDRIIEANKRYYA